MSILAAARAVLRSPAIRRTLFSFAAKVLTGGRRRPSITPLSNYSVSVEMEGVEKVVGKLAALERDAAKQGGEVSVTYTAPYAAYVHEDMEAQHANGKQAKYLEAPARRYRREMAKIVADTYRKTHNLEQALTAAAEFLLAKSQEIVPVDTGRLRDSGQVVVGGARSGGEETRTMWSPPRES